MLSVTAIARSTTPTHMLNHRTQNRVPLSSHLEMDLASADPKRPKPTRFRTCVTSMSIRHTRIYALSNGRCRPPRFIAPSGTTAPSPKNVHSSCLRALVLVPAQRCFASPYPTAIQIQIKCLAAQSGAATLARSQPQQARNQPFAHGHSLRRACEAKVTMSPVAEQCCCLGSNDGTLAAGRELPSARMGERCVCRVSAYRGRQRGRFIGLAIWKLEIGWCWVACALGWDG